MSGSNASSLAGGAAGGGSGGGLQRADDDDEAAEEAAAAAEGEVLDAAAVAAYAEVDGAEAAGGGASGINGDGGNGGLNSFCGLVEAQAGRPFAEEVARALAEAQARQRKKVIKRFSWTRAFMLYLATCMSVNEPSAGGGPPQVTAPFAQAWAVENLFQLVGRTENIPQPFSYDAAPARVPISFPFCGVSAASVAVAPEYWGTHSGVAFVMNNPVHINMMEAEPGHG